MIYAYVLVACVVGFLLGRATRSAGKRALILSLLERSGEMTGPELVASGVPGSPYFALIALEEEGLVACRSDGIEHAERGGQPRYYYRSTRV